MSKHIDLEKAEVWNKRFENRMKELGLSQRQFIRKYREKYETGSQADVSKWMHVGEKDVRIKERRGFPAFETMRNIADILDVSVGYLIGETDFETFEQERVATYLGLSAKPIEKIRKITSGKAIPPFFKYPDPQLTAALELLLENSFLVDYLKSICELVEAIDKKNNPKAFFKEAESRIPEAYREDALEFWRDEEQAIEKGVEPTDELRIFAKSLDDAACKDMSQPEKAEREIRAARYALHEMHIKVIDELLLAKNLSDLLPHYATSEEIKALYNETVNK